MIKLMRGDCLDLMSQIPDGSVDLVLTDPPYGTTACKWDSVIPFEPMWEHLKRITKPNAAIVLFGSQPFTSVLIVSNLKAYKYSWIWEKPSGANFLNFKYQPAKKHEDIVVFGYAATSYSKNGTLTYHPQMETGSPYAQRSGKQKLDYGNSSVRTPISQVTTNNNGERYPSSIQKFNPDTVKLHPTQKPVSLCEYLIRTYTNEGDTVLDFTMGSGTTGVACVNTNRSFIGIELDPDYYQIARQRIREAKS